MTDELDELISQSAAESYLDPEKDSQASSSLREMPLFNHPWAVIFAWLFCLSVVLFHWLEPIPKTHDLGVRSVEARLGIAVYHLAHHVETYRQRTGHLPDFIDEDWQESEVVSYHLGEDGYEITGRTGEFELVYREGDDPQGLIHRINQRETSSR